MSVFTRILVLFYCLVLCVVSANTAFAQQPITNYSAARASSLTALHKAELLAPPPPLIGTISVGVGRTYTTITAAVNAIVANGVIGAVTFRLRDASYPNETWPINLGTVAGASALFPVTIQANNGLAVNISASTTGAMFNFNGGKFWRIVPGSTTGSISIKNTNTGTAARVFQFTNGSTNNLISDIDISSSCMGTTTGTISFENTTVAGGNSSNTIELCNIHESNTSLPTNAIVSNSNTTAVSANVNNTIRNCNIYNFFSATSDNYGIYLNGGSSAWIITGNSFYQTATRNTTASSADLICIRIANTGSGNNFTISNNYIGGTAPLCGGGRMTMTGNGTFKGIRFAGGLGTASTISNNTIGNIEFTTGNTDINSLIYHSDGNLNITNNILGSQTITNSIIANSTIAAALYSGVRRSGNISVIFAGGAIGEPVLTSGVVNVTNNNIGGIQGNRIGAGDMELRMIDVENSQLQISITGNIVGGNVTNSILNNTDISTLGIFCTVGTAGFVHQVNNNTVRNMTASFFGGFSSVTGIKIQGAPAGSYACNNNNVSVLKSAYYNVGFIGSTGISFTSNGSNQQINDNIVHDISITNSSDGRSVGIYFATASTGTHSILRNKVTAVYNPAVTSGDAAGIDVKSSLGTTNVANNMVVMGYDGAGNVVTNNSDMYGILDRSAAGTNNFYYNSIHVGGTGVGGGTENTAAFYSTAANAITASVKNNNFVNTRMSAGGLNIGLALTNGASTSASGNNAYADVSAANAHHVFYNGGFYNSPASLFAASGQNKYSVMAPASFIDPKTDLRMVGAPSDVNFIISNEGDPIAGYTTDFFGNVRNSHTPDPGFHEYTCRGCWVGKNSTVWQTAGTAGAGGNWEDGVVPSNIIHAKVMNAPNQPTINQTTGTAATRDLFIKTPGYITLTNTTGGKLQVHRDFNNRDGAINGRYGVLEMCGTAAQTIPANLLVNNALMDLSIDNTHAASGVQIAGPVDVYRAFTFTTAGLRFNSNGNLTMKSTVDFTAYIGNLTGKTFVGDATIERYLRSVKAWRFLATPIAVSSPTTIRQAWQEGGSAASTGFGTQITGVGPSAIGMDQFTPNPSMKSYDPVINNYVGVTNTNSTIANKAGYMLFVRGDRSVDIYGSAMATNVRMKGQINQGNQAYTVPATKFQSIGNPYASEVDYRTVTKANVSDMFITWNPQSTGRYGYGAFETWVRSGANYIKVPGGNINNNIESGQAIYVQSNAATTGTITFKETDKATGSALVSRTAADAENLSENVLLFDLYVAPDASTEYLEDGVYIGLNNRYSKKVLNEDARKMLNSIDNLGILNETNLLSVDRRPLRATDTFFLKITQTSNGNYYFKAKPINLNLRGLQAYLVDKFTNDSIAISINQETKIKFEINGNPASKAFDRFYIVFRLAPRVPFYFSSAVDARTAQPGVNKITIEYDTNENVSAAVLERSYDGQNFSTIQYFGELKGAYNGLNVYEDNMAEASRAVYYRLKATLQNGTINYSNVAKIAGPNTPHQSKLTVYPNPITDGVANLALTGFEKGKYSYNVSSMEGKMVKTGYFEIAGAKDQKQISVAGLTGVYHLQIKNDAGTDEITKIFVY